MPAAASLERRQSGTPRCSAPPRIAVVALAVVVVATPGQTQEVRLKQITPLITVEAIEPCLAFWTERLGMTVTVSVPHEDRIGFVILGIDGLQLMYQARASVAADLGTMAPNHPGLAKKLSESDATLFIEVAALEPILEAMKGAEVVVPRRQTFYGMDELFVRAPCGTLVGFAARTGAD
jgi:hypothetical protein